MGESTADTGSSERRRLWVWLVAALLALLLFILVIKWTARQGAQSRAPNVLHTLWVAQWAQPSSVRAG